MSPKHTSGFTLAELLICLAILGEIATFTLPKVLQSQQDERKRSMSKEVAGILSDALLQYRIRVGITPGTSLDYDLFQYINYVKWDTASQIDYYPLFSGPLSCSVAAPCIKLHNGGILKSGGASWYDTNTTSAIGFTFDPDGAYTASNDSVNFNVYIDGAVRSRQYLKSNTTYPGPTVRGPQAGGDPSWFTW